jgi:tyrosine-protein phosphatase SIW14
MTETPTPDPAGVPPRPWRLRVLIVLAVVVAAAAGLVMALDATPKNFGVVDDGEVYRSGELTPRTLEWLAERRDVKTVIDLGAYHAGSEHERTMRELAERMGLNRYEFRMKGDGKGDPQDYARVLALLADPETHPVVVHCAAGAQRTGMAVLLYRTIVEGEPVGEAYQETLRYGHDPADNERFLTYLMEHIDEIRAAYEALRPLPASASGG